MRTIVDYLRQRAALDPDRPGYRFLNQRAESKQELTYGYLDRAARSIAAALKRARIHQVTNETRLSRRVAIDQPLVPFREHALEQSRAAQLFLGNRVLVQKGRQRPIRIEQITFRVIPVERASAQRAQNLQRFGRTKQSRAERGDLSFQHFRQMFNRNALAGKVEKIIGMIQPIGPAVGAQRMIDR